MTIPVVKKQAALIEINPDAERIFPSSADTEKPKTAKRAPSRLIDLEEIQDREEEAMVRALMMRKQNRIRPNYWN